MKQYTHAWLAMMAIKRLEKAEFSDNYKPSATSLVKWIKSYQDDVVRGAWYPDEVIKDMRLGHVLKFKPDDNGDTRFKKLPSSYFIYEKGKTSDQYGNGYQVTQGNLPDRCEALVQTIVDNMKMRDKETQGSPITPTNNHIATLFFMLSHYIADAHMPLHCDARAFSSEDDIHGYIEGKWDDVIRDCYSINEDQREFFCNQYGYPVQKANHQIITHIEQELSDRDVIIGYGTDNDNAWDFMSALCQYSYLLAYVMIPEGYNKDNLTKDGFDALMPAQTFNDYSEKILMDTIDSIARIWLHVWLKYEEWKN